MAKEKARETKLAAVPATAEKPQISAVETDECPRCFGTGMEIIEGKGARVCQCRKQKDHFDVLKRMRVPSRYLNCHFNSYQPRNRSQQAAAKYAIGLAQNYPAVEQGLLLTGTVGVGKTHLAVSILKGLAERGFKGLFYEFGSLLKEIQDSYNSNTRTSELSVLSPVLKADVLVLDELGASKPTDWVKDTMAHIINTRYNDKKITIFTTNYPDERANDREETLEDRIGARLRSRIYEMCKTVVITGEDHRRTVSRNS
jgi:DNA replication protein DnaC